MKKAKEIEILAERAINAIADIFREKDRRLTDADDVIDRIFCYYLSKSMGYISESMRLDYLQHRLMQLSMKLHAVIEDTPEVIERMKKEVYKKIFNENEKDTVH